MTIETDVIVLKARVHELEEHIKYLYAHLNIAYFESPAAGDAKIIEMLKSGRKIDAVRIYREMHNVGLADAKKAVDGMESRLGL